jgi:signal transduction histidine kinase
LYAPAAFSGDPTAKTATVEAIRGLSAINRDAMNNVDREAKRLGSAGAWSAVFLGLLGFTVGLVVVERLLHKVVHPLAELKSVLSSAMSGDRTRRCTPGSASSDVEYVKLSINTLLDQGTRSDTPAGREVSHCRAARTVLLHLLDEVEGPRLVVDQRGSIISANAAALERLRGEEGKDIKERLIEVAREDENKSSWVIARFPEADCVLCGIDA